ncbi:hypothetical protein Pmani_014470 [Petrolisthes manimaculis]|uniref:Uncharacterized protein n=1 Tax=Petrolisthes manimaculis TaxID=1843537 RepID=A0AAE1PWF3_9EUCA|nr:hypothetical protein Pmani_014470 [Petrolisthes manimaculis]
MGEACERDCGEEERKEERRTGNDDEVFGIWQRVVGGRVVIWGMSTSKVDGRYKDIKKDNYSGTKARNTSTQPATYSHKNT